MTSICLPVLGMHTLPARACSQASILVALNYFLSEEVQAVLLNRVIVEVLLTLFIVGSDTFNASCNSMVAEIAVSWR